jgi:S-adenosyl methyltransferase
MTFDAPVPNAARIYNFFLGGKDNFAIDREAAQKMLAVLPGTVDACLDSRAFLQRAVRFLAREAGIRQFLDIGAGLPTMGNVHEVAQEIAPDARVAYVDYDPVVLSHARALLATNPNVIVVEGDLRLPEPILAGASLRELIDFSRPVALLLVGVLHFVSDRERPHEAVQALVDALPSGSYLVLAQSTPDDVPQEVTEAMISAYTNASAQVTPRSFEEVAKFFAGLELIEPGVVGVTHWRPELPPGRPLGKGGRQSLVYGGVAAKP